MATPFLSSEEYDERAHRLYNAGDYDQALETLKEGLVLYPHCADLHVGLGYTRLAREEFAWARKAFETAIALEPDHEDALVGLGEVLLRLGRKEEALELFERVRRGAGADDLELLLSMGRALYRAGLFQEACGVFVEATELHPDSADAHAALGYTLHRLGRMGAARRELRRALRLDPHLHEARIYLGHLLYEKGEFEAALRQFERVPTSEHWDPLALWRLVELKQSIDGLRPDHPLLAEWEARRVELETPLDPIDALLAEIERGVLEAEEDEVWAKDDGGIHCVRLPDGQTYHGSWFDIVRQLRDAIGCPGESVAQFMRRQADEQRARTGIGIPSDDPEAFLRASARAGLLWIEC